MSGRDPAMVLVEVQGRLESDFEATGWQSFAIERLVAAGLGSEAEVTSALLKLRAMELVDITAHIRCRNLDHIVHACPPEDVKGNLGRLCPDVECGEPCDADDVELLFRISDGWAAAIRKRAAKKKAQHTIQ